jgi:hypothetical protein
MCWKRLYICNVIVIPQFQTHPNPTCSQAAWVWTTLATKGPAPICEGCEGRFVWGMFRLGWDKYGGDSHNLCSNSNMRWWDMSCSMSFYLMWRSCESRKTSKWTWKWRENGKRHSPSNLMAITWGCNPCLYGEIKHISHMRRVNL